MTRRGLAAIAAALLLCASPVAAQDWRPAPVDRLAALDRALVPVHALMVDRLDALSTAIGTLQAQASGIRTKDIAATAALVDLAADELQQAAADGLAALDAAGWEPCMADYVAVERTAMLLVGDSIDSLRAGALGEGGAQIGAGRFLLTTYGDLVRAVTVCP